ncbi:nucleoside diphosphate kinase [Chryseobacterium bernardetii]|uniref:Uncharacterized protein n=3 Tax=Chryseobacterium TaxID=59732 RepID=A0A543DVB1_9FLAO|nr:MULTISPECIES: hypothetical protein [Chryseobacterium]MDR6373159.1 nucleoside diphosphate kinase [Chryseobacterium vietnamense]MDR6443597.1 nucleoside diphosphate kinase [Chryseobacterium bernardetii]MDR6461205.1 nucleoside diphosphate kinase [Chryseobacterium vietnamense]TQM13257.1 hypothetical protein FB551_4628 [Chryseobacterium aquifrigidense]
MEDFINKKLSVEIEKAITQLEYRIVELKTMQIEPDLSYLNSFYKERTEENINRLNSRIKIPKLSLYIWISSFAMLIFSFVVFFFVFSKLEETKTKSIKEYKNQLSKNSVIMSKQNAELLKDMDLWFKSDPQSTSKFIHWRQSQR